MKKEEVVPIRDELRNQLEAKNKNVKVGKITYYNDFEIIKGDENHSPFVENHVFVVNRKVEQDGLELEYYEIYDEHYKLIATTDGAGEIEYSDEYVKKLGPMYSYLGLEKRTMYLNKENEFMVNDKPKEDLTQEEVKENSEKEQEYKERKIDSSEPALIEDDLGMSRESISYCQEITDSRFFDMVPESKEFSRTAMLIYSEKTDSFMIVGVKDGKFQPYSTIEPSVPTLAQSKDLDRDGSDIKAGNISGILQFTGDREFDFAVDIEGDGRVEFQQIRRDLETGEFITSDLETDEQYRATWKVEQMMDKNENEDIEAEIQRIEAIGEGAKIEEIEDERQKVPWDRDPRR